MRTDIQLLRGVAVLAVMLAHFGALAPGGFLGVDIFFAISGFVITLSFIKLWSRESNRRNLLRKFWLRRFWRLFPALSVVLTATLVSALFLLPAEDFRDQLEMTVWSFFFAGNIGVEVVSQQDYFDPAANFNWLLHLWSLGVEEQFYLIFPFIMLFLLGRFMKTSSQTAVISAVIAGSLISFLLAGVNEFEVALMGEGRLTESTGFSAALGYYSPLTRAWQFGVGIIAALLTLNTPRKQTSRLLPIAGITVLSLSLLLMPESNLLPGPLSLVPMVAMFVLLRYPLSTRATDSLLARPLSWLGDRSYSAYLWHWPVWSVLTQLSGEGVIVIVMAFLTTLVLAGVTYRFIERPLIDRYRSIEVEERPRSANLMRKRLSVGAILVAPLLLSGFIVGAENGLRDAGVIGQRAPVPQVDPALDCIQTSCDGIHIDVLLVGDSHAGALANALSLRLRDNGITMKAAVVARHFGCLHLPSETISSIHEECVGLSREVRNLILHLSPAQVIVFGYTAGRFTTTNSGGYQEISLVDNGTGELITDDTGASAYRVALEETKDTVNQAGGHLVVVSGTPDFDLRPEEAGQNGETASLAETFLLAFTGHQFGQVTSREQQLSRHGGFREVEQELVRASPSITWIDSWDSVCGPDVCEQVDRDGNLVFSDQDHLSEMGAQMLASAVADSIAELEH